MTASEATTGTDVTEAITTRLLGEVLDCAGRTPAPDGSVTIEGADPVFPLALRIGEAGAAVIAATGVAASDLWVLRGGRSQRVAVDVRAAAAAMRSHSYLRVEEGGDRSSRPRGVRTEVSGMYETRDGRWIYLHCNFPHHRERIVSLLGASDDPEGVARAVSTWRGAELEQAIVARSACAGLVRDAEEWAATEQARAIEGLPLFEVTKIGESAPEPLPEAARPLSGIRVLDLTRVLAGPTCARTLAEHGAEVLRIGTDRLPNNTLQTMDTGHGKRSTVLDLRDAAGVERLLELAAAGDVFSQGYRPGSFAARGLSPEALAKRRPGIVYVSLSAFGHEGPWRERRGFDTLVQSVSGISHEYALDGRPRLLPVSALDYITGYLAAFGVMTALAHRAVEGGSYHVRLSLARTGRWLTGMPRIPADRATAAEDDLSAEEIARLTTLSKGPFGRVRHLAPVVGLSETSPRWEQPAVPLDHHEASWA